jgi:hypothetical protein
MNVQGSVVRIVLIITQLTSVEHVYFNNTFKTEIVILPTFCSK